jgi:hypothetical protein
MNRLDWEHQADLAMLSDAEVGNHNLNVYWGRGQIPMSTERINSPLLPWSGVFFGLPPGVHRQPPGSDQGPQTTLIRISDNAAVAENINQFLKAGTGANWRGTKKLQDCPVISDHGHEGRRFLNCGGRCRSLLWAASYHLARNVPYTNQIQPFGLKGFLPVSSAICFLHPAIVCTTDAHATFEDHIWRFCGLNDKGRGWQVIIQFPPAQKNSLNPFCRPFSFLASDSQVPTVMVSIWANNDGASCQQLKFIETVFSKLYKSCPLIEQ